MQITSLGHAGFCVETHSSIIIMDPWFSKQGAFDSAWFQYPKNHHMGDYVQAILARSKKNKYIYISHEHQDHFDIKFLQSLTSRNFTILLANYSCPVVKNKLNEVNYRCNNIIFLNDNEKYTLRDAEIRLFIMDTELNCDSAILVQTESNSFLNINDCKIYDRLENIKSAHGNIDIFTAQFSGASWYPTCYQMSDNIYREVCQKKIASKFETTAAAIKTIKPRLYLTSAGPPCFLDPLLLPIHFQDIHSYPDAPQFLTYLDQHCESMKSSTKWKNIWPGDRLDVASLKVIHQSSNRKNDTDFKSQVISYADEYKEFFSAREKDQKQIDPEAVFLQLKRELLDKLSKLRLVNHTINTLLYWRMSECPEKMYCIDLMNKTIEVTSCIKDLNNYYRMTAPAWLVNKVLTGEMNWPDFALTFRVTIERVPDVYNTVIHGFLILDTNKIQSFCEKMQKTNTNNERIIKMCEGKQYSILRYCPHQGADLSQGYLEGPLMVCPRHQWKFDIKNNGKCIDNETCIDAICLDNQ